MDDLNKKKVFDWMEKNGYARIEVEYSGGGDEGGVNEINVFGEGDTKLDVELEENDSYRYIDGKWQQPEKSVEDLMVDILVSPVYDEYGSFAGDFDCYGTVTWNAVTKKIFMDDNVKSDYTNITKEI